MRGPSASPRRRGRAAQLRRDPAAADPARGDVQFCFGRLGLRWGLPDQSTETGEADQLSEEVGVLVFFFLFVLPKLRGSCILKGRVSTV